MPCIIDRQPVVWRLWLRRSRENPSRRKKSSDRQRAIWIDSDRLDAYNDQACRFFRKCGCCAGDKTIKSEKILLYYKKGESGAQKVASKEVGKTGDLERIEAKGNVILTQGERVVTGDEAVYYQGSQKIVMSGNAVMRENRNIIRGDRIVVFINENRGMVESTQRKRVTATIYPSEKDEKKR
jgi:lipopolysaccharide export system protein LptA